MYLGPNDATQDLGQGLQAISVEKAPEWFAEKCLMSIVRDLLDGLAVVKDAAVDVRKRWSPWRRPILYDGVVHAHATNVLDNWIIQLSLSMARQLVAAHSLCLSTLCWAVGGCGTTIDVWSRGKCFVDPRNRHKLLLVIDKRYNMMVSGWCLSWFPTGDGLRNSHPPSTKEYYFHPIFLVWY